MPLWWLIGAVFLGIYLSCGFILFVLDCMKNKEDYLFEFIPWSCIEIMINWIFVVNEYRKYGRILYTYQREWKSELSEEQIKEIIDNRK